MDQNSELLKPTQIIYSKRQTVSLIIKENGQFIVRSPRKVDPQRILDFIQKKQTWILKTRLKLAQAHANQPKIEIQDGGILPFLGQSITLKFDQTLSKDCIYDPISLVLILNPHQNPAPKIVIGWLKTQARKILNQELENWAKIMQLNPAQFRLSSAKTRWGSCSGKNVISLNWRLILTPIQVLQYVVAHELAHIEHKNHSKDFWDLVCKYDPNFKKHQKYLKIYGSNLMDSFG